MGVHPPITPLSGLSSSLYSHFFNARPLGLSGQVQAAGFFAAIFKTLYCLEEVFSEIGLPVLRSLGKLSPARSPTLCMGCAPSLLGVDCPSLANGGRSPPKGRGERSCSTKQPLNS